MPKLTSTRAQLTSHRCSEQSVEAKSARWLGRPVDPHFSKLFAALQ